MQKESSCDAMGDGKSIVLHKQPVLKTQLSKTLENPFIV